MKKLFLSEANSVRGVEFLTRGAEVSISYLPEAIIPLFKNATTKSSAWQTDNKKFIILEDQNYYHIALDMIYLDDELEVGPWLLLNDIHIDFSKCYWAIEIRHKILEQNSGDIKAVRDPGITFETCTYSDLMLKISSAGVDTTRDNYNSFFKVALASTGLNISQSDYSLEYNVYSIPLINAIVSNHGLNTANTTFSFAQTKISGKKVTFFVVKENGNEIGIYDFSHRPPVKL